MGIMSRLHAMYFSNRGPQLVASAVALVLQ